MEQHAGICPTRLVLVGCLIVSLLVPARIMSMLVDLLADAHAR